MTPSEVRSARRARAVNRAITAAVANPSEQAFALSDWLQTAPAEAFDTDLVDVQIDRGESWTEYWIDGVCARNLMAAVAMLQNRYGLTRAEAEALIPGTPASRRPSSVAPIGGAW